MWLERRQLGRGFACSTTATAHARMPPARGSPNTPGGSRRGRGNASREQGGRHGHGVGSRMGMQPGAGSVSSSASAATTTAGAATPGPSSRPAASHATPVAGDPGYVDHSTDGPLPQFHRVGYRRACHDWCRPDCRGVTVTDGDENDDGPSPRWLCAPIGCAVARDGSVFACIGKDLTSCQNARDISGGRHRDQADLRRLANGAPFTFSSWTVGQWLANGLQPSVHLPRGYRFDTLVVDYRWMAQRP